MPAKPKLTLSVQHADKRLAELLARADIRRWVQAAQFATAEFTVRFVDEGEARSLNRDYRGKDYATNVLTFAYADGEEVSDDDVVQADIVLCVDVLLKEAEALAIPVQQHAAHLIVHGTLHAQGYDHEDDEEAAEMEGLETEILAGLGIPDPYQY
jgi:probable rRNA maturation factor